MLKVPRFVNEFFNFRMKEKEEKWRNGLLVYAEKEEWKAKAEIEIRKYKLGLVTLHSVIETLNN